MIKNLCFPVSKKIDTKYPSGGFLSILLIACETIFLAQDCFVSLYSYGMYVLVV